MSSKLKVRTTTFVKTYYLPAIFIILGLYGIIYFGGNNLPGMKDIYTGCNSERGLICTNYTVTDDSINFVLKSDIEGNIIIKNISRNNEKCVGPGSVAYNKSAMFVCKNKGRWNVDNTYILYYIYNNETKHNNIRIIANQDI